MREGTPRAEALDIHPRIDVVADLPQVAIPTLPVTPITGAEVPTPTPTPQSPHIASRVAKPGRISIGAESSPNPIGSTSVLDQPLATRSPPSIAETSSSDPFALPQLDIKPPAPAAPLGSSDTATISPDFIEPPRPITGLASSSPTRGAPPIKATNLAPTTFDQWAPQAQIEIKPKLPDVTPEPVAPKVVASLPENIGPKQMSAPETLVQRSDEIRQPLAETFGGSKQTEDAVARALDYLSRYQ